MQNMTTLYMYSRPIGLRFEFDGYKESKFDPTSVSNGCWDQKLARVAAWWHGAKFQERKHALFCLAFFPSCARKKKSNLFCRLILPCCFRLCLLQTLRRLVLGRFYGGIFCDYHHIRLKILPMQYFCTRSGFFVCRNSHTVTVESRIFAVVLLEIYRAVPFFVAFFDKKILPYGRYDWSAVRQNFASRRPHTKN